MIINKRNSLHCLLYWHLLQWWTHYQTLWLKRHFNFDKTFPYLDSNIPTVPSIIYFTNHTLRWSSMQFIFRRFTTSPYSEYYAIKSMVLKLIVSSYFLKDFEEIEKYSVNWIHIMKDGIDNYILVHSWLLFHYYVLRLPWILYKKSLKIPKGQSKSVYRRRTDNTMAKRKSTKGQTTIYKTYQ